MRRILVLSLAALAITVTAASAQSPDPTADPPESPQNERIDRFTVDLVADLLDTLGLIHQRAEGTYGEPAIIVDGTLEPKPDSPAIDRFEIRFLGCDSAGRCDELTLVSRYKSDGPTSLTTVNRFNQATRFTTAYTGSDGELILSMDLSAVGGIGRQATMIMIAIYVYNMESFAQAIG